MGARRDAIGREAPIAGSICAEQRRDPAAGAPLNYLTSLPPSPLILILLPRAVLYLLIWRRHSIIKISSESSSRAQAT